MIESSLAREDENSARTRVTPVFSWLRENGGVNWPTEFLRLAWMIRNAHRLTPQDGRRWREYATRVINNPAKQKALALLDGGTSEGVPKPLILEGSTHADCLIECERAFVWIEGKRNDWLSPCIKWDVTRDQLARNLEAAWVLATAAEKDFWLVICHEHELKHHEAALAEGYRNGTWSAGWPHLSAETRSLFREKIGTLAWATIFRRWPEVLAGLPPAKASDVCAD